jgi:hypothetical protein
MTPSQAIGYALNQTSAITAIVGNRIFAGNRISTGTAGTIILPAINYFDLPGGIRKNGIESVTYSINCRAKDKTTADQLSRLVVDLFHGTASTGIYGTMNNFNVARASLRNLQGGIFEASFQITEQVYNCSVDIQFVYESSTIS